MIHADKTRAIMRPEKVEPTTRRLKYLLGSFDEELTFQDTRHALKEHFSQQRVAQVSSTGQVYWTLVDSHGTVFRLAQGPRWEVYVESGLPDKDREHLLEELVELSAWMNSQVQKQAA